MKHPPCLCILLFVGVSSTKHMSFTKTSTKLPLPRSSSGAVYDGDDSIYVFGGVYGPFHFTDEVLKYTISTDEISVVAKFSSIYGESFRHNSVSINSRGRIHAFASYGDVYEFDPLTNDVKNVSSLNTWMGPFVQISKDFALCFFPEGSSYPLSVVQIDLRTMNATVLFQHIPKDIRLTAAAFDKKNSVVYCPGYYPHNYTGIVAKFDIKANRFSVIATELPGHLHPSGAVWYKGKMYVVGGTYAAQNDKGIAVFDPAELSYEFLPVAGINKTVEIPTSQAMVYVEKLKRIYVFGGSRNSIYYDSVGYFKFGRSDKMDFETDESVTFCFGMADGFYPKPGSSTTYISCADENSEEYECPDTFVFDPQLKTCQ